MKKIILLVGIIVAFTTPVFADYTVDIKNENGDVLKTYIVTTAQVQHLQKVTERTGKSVLNQFKEAILDLVSEAEESNMVVWDGLNKEFRKNLAKE